MQAIILTAGQSSRFWPLNKVHKTQLNFLGKPLVYWAIKEFSEKGIKDIILIIGPNSSIEKEINSLFYNSNIKITYIVQEKSLGTGNAISKARDLIKEPFFLFWPDKHNTGEIIDKILEKEKQGYETVLIGDRTDTPWNYGILKIDGDKILEIVENPKQGQEPSNIKLIGSCFLQPDFFNYYESLSKHREQDFIDALNIYIKNKKTGLVLFNKELTTLKYPWESLVLLEKIISSYKFKSGISQTAKLGKNIIINKDVYIGENVTIGDNVTINGPCFIGDNCKIGANSVLRGPINLEKNVVVGSLSEIKSCIIQEGTHVHSGYFGNSVIGKNCKFGAGFITANRRIDRGNIKSTIEKQKIDTGLTYFGTAIGDNTSFGIHSGTMPGVLVGSNCTIGPASIVFKNLEDNTTFYSKFEGIKKNK